jgi:hypothetical protein
MPGIWSTQEPPSAIGGSAGSDGAYDTEAGGGDGAVVGGVSGTARSSSIAAGTVVVMGQ